MTYKITRKLVPLEFREYVDRATGKLITSAAVAQVEGAAGQADFVIRRGEDGIVTMALFQGSRRNRAAPGYFPNTVMRRHRNCDRHAANQVEIKACMSIGAET